MTACNSGCGSPNCERVVLVERVYAPGIPPIPIYEEWGVITRYPACADDIYCCGGEECPDGCVCSPTSCSCKCPPENPMCLCAEGKGVIQMELLTDEYDENGCPIGKYNQQCCCDLWVSIHDCFRGHTYMKLDRCSDELPAFNPESDILKISGDFGAFSLCGYTAPPNRVDSCGEEAPDWVISYGGAWGCGSNGDRFLVGGASIQGLKFVREEYDPAYEDDPGGITPNRYCLELCPSCWGLFTPCAGACDIHRLGGQPCLASQSCDAHDETVCQDDISSIEEGKCFANDIHGISLVKDCREREAVLSGKEVADQHFHLPPCECGPTTPTLVDGQELAHPCDMCALRYADICACESVTCECWSRIFDTWHPTHPPNLLSKFKWHYAGVEDECCYPSTYSPSGCYNNKGMIMPGNIGPSHYYSFGYSAQDIQTCQAYPGHIGPSGCPSGCFYSCMICPPQDPDDCLCCHAGFPNCDGEPDPAPPGIDEHGMTRYERWFPNLIEATITTELHSAPLDINIKFGNAEVVTFDADSETAGVINSVNSSQSTWQYTMLEHEMTEPINNHTVTGACVVDGVPMLEEAIYLGNSFDLAEGEWSTWLYVSPCIANTMGIRDGKNVKPRGKHPDVTDGQNRMFSFHYTLFAYCDCPRTDKECNCKSDSFVIGDTMEVVFEI